MSLTSELDVKDSPVGSFFRERFPFTRAPLAECRKALQAPPIIHLPGHAAGGVYGQIGAAVDYRIRYHFAHTPWTQLAAARGANSVSFRLGKGADDPTAYVPADPIYRIDGVPPEAIDESARGQLAPILGVPPAAVVRPTRIDNGPPTGGRVSYLSIGSTAWVPEDPVSSEFFEDLDQAVAEIAPHRRLPDEEQERTLARFCLILAAFEAVYRTAHPSAWPPPYFGDILPRNAAELLCLVPDDWVEDAAALGAAFARRYPSWHGADAILNPSFAGSENAGGADADLIVDNCLWEIRTTKKRRAQGIWLYQVLGYALLDYEDEFAIERVGFLLPRQDTRVSWSLGELIVTLSGREDLAIPELQENFRQICESGHGVE